MDWVQALAALGVGGVFTAVISAIAQRKKNTADTSNVVVDSAGNQVIRLDAEIEKKKTELSLAYADRARFEHESNIKSAKIRGWYERADAYTRWARRLTYLLDEHAITYPPAPELYPPEDSRQG